MNICLPIITVCILVDDNGRGKQQKTVCTEAHEDSDERRCKALNISGPFNVQFMSQAHCKMLSDDFSVSKQSLGESMGFHLINEFCITFYRQEGSSSSLRAVKVIECNVRASRTVRSGQAQQMLVEAVVKAPFHSLHWMSNPCCIQLGKCWKG